MRRATILIANLGGTATETIKNIVLAGIGKLIIVDDKVVSEEDLGAGFFFRDEDVGSKVSDRLLLGRKPPPRGVILDILRSSFHFLRTELDHLC
jgi:molybdopterin/thiamine biosynthesis adenylyltransferase